MIRYSLKRAGIVKLVYALQLKPLKLKYNINTVVFPNFVPIKNFLDAQKNDHKYILLVGYPWYLKGVDVLIKAFKKISPNFPQYKLKIVGWCPEGREYFEKLANNNPKIELCDPVYYNEVVQLMANCSVYVLASRTDSSPRVLREAMASHKPIIASNIDGVPELIIDGFNGLLFKKEDYTDLAEKLTIILSDKKFAQQISKNGHDYVQKKLSERVYINKYKSMLEDLL